MTPDEVRKLVREEIAKHRNDAPHRGPGHPTESSAPTPAAETCAECGYVGRHGMACPGRPDRPAPDASKGPPEFPTSAKQFPTLIVYFDAEHVDLEPLPKGFAITYVHPDVVEKRVAEAVAAYRASEEGSGWWHGVGSALGCNSEEGLISAAIRVVADRDEARANLAAAEARVRELELALATEKAAVADRDADVGLSDEDRRICADWARAAELLRRFAMPR